MIFFLTTGLVGYFRPTSLSSSNDINLMPSSLVCRFISSEIFSITTIYSKFDFELTSCNALSESSHTTTLSSAFNKNTHLIPNKIV